MNVGLWIRYNAIRNDKEKTSILFRVSILILNELGHWLMQWSELDGYLFDLKKTTQYRIIQFFFLSA